MKTIRIILITFLAIYAAGTLFGSIMCFANPAKMVEWQKLGTLTPALEKLLLLAGSLMLAQFWIYFSAIALLSRNMKEGYMYAVTLGFIELIQAIAIVFSFATHGFGTATDYLALVKGLVLLVLALVAFKKSQLATA
jgi:hypothetical protein